jgi:Txe/YoeB family toxin of Txe-Axe toxin-antitoxin module
MFSNQNPVKSCLKFYCEICDYGTQRKSAYEEHLATAKHKKSTFSNQNPANPANPANPFVCTCGKSYKDKSGLWRHKKKCISDNVSDSDSDSESDSESEKGPSDKELIMMLIKENSEFKNMMMKVLENGTHNTTTNSHNKSFNLQFFLNETCKNAMNINEFADSLQLQMSDLENVGESGYIEGISSIIIKKLNTLDITERPIHCTDKKRETMYIKDQDKWEKEDEKKTKMHKLVTKVANKNITMISEFQKLHPEWKKCSSKYADQHNKIVIESMGGKGDNEYEKQEKIIKKIAKEVFVDKCL